METSSSGGTVFRFGPFEVNLRTGELRKRGIRVTLQEQPLKILVALLEQPGEMVSRQDLCSLLWPHGTFVDFEHSLNAAVRRLRVALGDDAETPRFIETVHRRGYRFLTWGPRAVTDPHAARKSHPAKARVAVLPFLSLDEPCRKSFIEGLTEEMTSQLARLAPPHVGVLARTAVLRQITAEDQSQERLRLSGVDYVVEGSLRCDGDRVRIVAQLIAASDDTHVWAAGFDRVLTDPLTVQMEVAEEIAATLSAVLARVSAPLQPLSREAAS